MDRRSVLGLMVGFAARAGLPEAAAAAEEGSVRLDVGGGSIELSLDSGFDLPKPAILEWVRRSAQAVSGYFGRFPVTRARIRVHLAEGRAGVSRGTSFGFNGAHTRIYVGQHTTEGDLERDWMMTHEMVHFGFPSVPEQHHWIEEGIATYVEPIARAAIGNLSPESVWGDMVRDMPQGQPEAGDRGLDFTPTWGRTYWGGAIYCLLADVGIRKHTRNALGLRDALRAINRAGGIIESDWPLQRALEMGDRATRGRVLSELYEQMRARPVTVDLDDLWKQLGVSRRGDKVAFDNAAPLESIRTAILS